MNPPEGPQPPAFELPIGGVPPAVVPLSTATISSFLEWAGGAPRGARDAIREEIAKVAGNNALVLTLCGELSLYAQDDPVRQLLLLSTIGETRNPIAIPALAGLIWLDPGPPAPGDTGADPGAFANPAPWGANPLPILQSRAVEMLAYIGGEEADGIVLDVVDRHSVRSVRGAAIDAYLFNHGDSAAALERVSEAVRPGDAALIGRPRFKADADPQQFGARDDVR